MTVDFVKKESTTNGDMFFCGSVWSRDFQTGKWIRVDNQQKVMK